MDEQVLEIAAVASRGPQEPLAPDTSPDLLWCHAWPIGVRSEWSHHTPMADEACEVFATLYTIAVVYHRSKLRAM